MRLNYIPSNYRDLAHKLVLEFDDIANVTAMLKGGNPASVTAWNNFFLLPTNGSPFTSVVVAGNSVYLYGGHDITVKWRLFESNVHLISVDDHGCIVQIDESAFSVCTGVISFNFPVLHTVKMAAFLGCTSVPFFYCPELLTTDILSFASTCALAFNFPKLKFVGQSCFQDCQWTTTFILPLVTSVLVYGFLRCYAGTTYYLPSVNTFGPNVWHQDTGNSILLTVPAAMMVINGGQPHYQIAILMSNNDVTVVQV